MIGVSLTWKLTKGIRVALTSPNRMGSEDAFDKGANIT